MAKPKTPPCRLPTAGQSLGSCGTAGKTTICVGDRVSRSEAKLKGMRGTVLDIQQSADNSGRKKIAAVVCWDGSEPNELAYRFLFPELKKLKG